MIIKNDDEGILLFDGEKVRAKTNKMSEGAFQKITAALSKLDNFARIGVMVSESSLDYLKEAAFKGIMSEGKYAVDCGCGFLTLLNHAIVTNKLDYGIFIDKKKDIFIYFRDCYGRSIPCSKYNAIKQSYQVINIKPKQGNVLTLTNLWDSYFASLSFEGLEGMKLHIECENTKLHATLCDKLAQSGVILYPYEALGTKSLKLSRNGMKIFAKDESMKGVHPAQLFGIVLQSQCEKGIKEIAYSYTSPTLYDRICGLNGVKYYKVYDIKTTISDEYARKLSAENPLMFDGIFAMLTLCRHLSRTKQRLKDIKQMLPSNITKVQNIWIPASRKEYVLYKLANKGEDGRGEGVAIFYNNASVVATSSVTGGIRLMVEAQNSETAEELCSFYKREIYRLAERAEQ